MHLISNHLIEAILRAGIWLQGSTGSATPLIDDGSWRYDCTDGRRGL